MKRVLVVCTGNICRSPLAEAWLQKQWGEAVKVESAGTAALIGHSADKSAVEVASENGLDITKHRARQVNAQMLYGIDLILTMEKQQRDQIIAIAPWCTGKVWRLGENAGQDVSDPYQRGRTSFEQAFNTITKFGQSWLFYAKAS